MIDFKIVNKILGTLLFMEAFMMAVCLVMSLCYGEDDSLAFLLSIICTLLVGFILRYKGRNAGNNLSRREAYLVVNLVWILFSIMGTLPFIIGGYLPTFTDAFFENMSGFTTTGATIIDDVEVLPHGILFWRSLTHWIGGLGIVFFTVALLPSMVGGSTRVFAAESTGPFHTKLHPRLSTNTKWIGVVYITLTVACILCYVCLGMSWFDGINYAMATTATGGFSTHNASIEYFNSPAIDYVCTFFMFISGVSFTLLYFCVAKLKFKQLFKNSELRFYITIMVFFTAIVMYQLVVHNHYGLEHAFRSSVFHVVSYITTTGFYNDDATFWPPIVWVVISVCMFFGACSGSTSGGLKCVRVVMLLRVVQNEFKQILHPNAVLPLRIDGQNVSEQKRITLLAFLTCYLILCVIASVVLIASGIDNTNAITIALSSLGNVGPTLGREIGAIQSWNVLPFYAKWICSILMLIGRLEIFSVLVILTPGFWNKN